MENKNALNDLELRQVNGGILPKDHYENIIIGAAPNQEIDWQVLNGDDSPDLKNT